MYFSVQVLLPARVNQILNRYIFNSIYDFIFGEYVIFLILLFAWEFCQFDEQSWNAIENYEKKWIHVTSLLVCDTLSILQQWGDLFIEKKTRNQ